MESKNCTPSSAGALLLRFLVRIAVLAAAFTVIFTYVLGIYVNHGLRMDPAIKDGDLLILYRLGEYRTGEAVVYSDPLTGKRAAARICAAGGSVVNLAEDGTVTIDGVSATENVFYPTEKVTGSDVRFPYLVTEGAFFLLNDCRTQEADSRLFGEVTEDALLGKAAFVLRRRGI